MSTGLEVQHVEIFITGLPQSGKSTFVKTISQYTAFDDNDPASWYEGYLPVDATLDVHFLEPPVMQEFDFLWLRELIEEFDVPGFIVMCDSTMPELFGEMIGILQTVLVYHPETPVILVANKQDCPNAWTASDIRMGLGIPDEILVLPCVATRKDLVKEAVLQLLYRVMGS